MDTSQLTFKISGEEFNNGYNLFHLNKGLNNFHTLIDKAYLTIEDRKKMSEKDREILQIKAYDIREGSFEADLVIHLTGVSLSLFPAFQNMTPKDLWNLVTKGYEYLKKIFELNSQGIIINMYPSGDNNGNINIINGDGDILIEEAPEVLRYASLSQRTFDELARSINPLKGIDSFNVYERGNNSNKLIIGEEEKLLFENITRIEDETISFKGYIFKSNAENFTGKLKVLETSAGIGVGDYNFEFAVKDNEEKLKDTYLTEKTFFALRETTLNAGTLQRKISKLKIVEVRD
ncbi:hypothetical protein [Paraliobacillus zengyii]|uniref:hypothetical protein n=1 Tax=Paraliobacillus zengyii TaxID=2213194 RepID=UPI000DD4B155|nr:hypothetical protein [Paraliobacillus zengyii]